MSLPKPYYEDGSVTIYHGDCRELLPDIEADVLVTDPPYGVEFKGKRTKHTTKFTGGYASTKDDSAVLAELILPTIRHLLKGRAVVTPGVRNLFAYPEPSHIGAIYYPSGAGMSRWGFLCWQPILFYGPDPHLTDGKGSRPDSFTTTVAAEKNGHPCPKPLETMAWLINRCSREGETILDPFMGSGTTLRAAKDLGRKAIGIELEERYCEIAAERCSQEVLDLGMAA